MNKQDKAQLIEELTEKFKEKNFFYLADGSGMTVAEVNDFRRLCHSKGIEYKVIKNTLVKKALEQLEADFTPLDDTALKGFTGILFATDESSNAPAKIIKEFRKKSGSERPSLKAASIDSDLFIGEEHLTALSNLKSKGELLGDIIALLQSPAKNVIASLQSSEQKLAGIVKTLQEREN